MEPIKDGAVTPEELFYRIRAGLAESRINQEQALAEIAAGIIPAYRAAFGDEFTAQKVISASQSGAFLPQWDSLDDRTQGTLWALGARYPEVLLDTEKVAAPLSEAMVETFRRQNVAFSPEQSELLPAMLKDLFTAIEQVGFPFKAGPREPYMQGLRQLVPYCDWLGASLVDEELRGQQLSLDVARNAIKAHGQALEVAVVAARNIKVRKGYSESFIIGIETAKVTENIYAHLTKEPRWTLEYHTKDGKTGKIDLMASGIEAVDEKRVLPRIYDLFFEGRVEPTVENLFKEHDEGIDALIGMPPKDVYQELRINSWRQHLKQVGADFSQNPEIILLDKHSPEKITFFYGTKKYQNTARSEDTGVMVALQFDERYSDSLVYVCPRTEMEEQVRMSAQFAALADNYQPFLSLMPVLEYRQRGNRLTKSRP